MNNQHEEGGTGRGQDMIPGRNAVQEALKSGRAIDCIYVRRGNVQRGDVQRGERQGTIRVILSMAKERGIPVKEADEKKLRFLSGTENHQGVVAAAAVKEYAQLEDVLALAEERGEPPFVIVCDGLEDPRNLGAIVRTAECAGAHGVVIPKRHSAGLTYASGKSSAGAVEYVPVVRVSNLADTVAQLKKEGLWIYAADMDGQAWCETDLQGPLALIIGSEGRGVGRLLREKSDFVLSLPMKGKISSLNASVAAGVICYEVARQRSGIKAINP